MRTAVHIIVGLLLVTLFPEWAGADGGARVYRHLDTSGVIRYTNIPPYPSFTSSSQVRPAEPSGSLRAMITSTASKHGISARLVEAIVAVESAFNPSAVSPKGAMGLMQLMPKTASQYAVGNPFDPLQNLQGGIQFLRDLLDRFRGDLRLALAAYNAGEKAVVENDGIPPYRETREYVQKVLYRYSGSAIIYPRPAPDYRVYRVIGPGGTPHYSNIPPRTSLR